MCIRDRNIGAITFPMLASMLSLTSSTIPLKLKFDRTHMTTLIANISVPAFFKKSNALSAVTLRTEENFGILYSGISIINGSSSFLK